MTGITAVDLTGGTPVPGIFFEARRLTHRGYSLVDSLEFLLTSKPESFEARERKQARALIDTRQSLRDKHAKAVQKVLADVKARQRQAKLNHRRQIERMADDLLNNPEGDDDAPIPVPRHQSDAP